jgi:hypothetical protein
VVLAKLWDSCREAERRDEYDKMAFEMLENFRAARREEFGRQSREAAAPADDKAWKAEERRYFPMPGTLIITWRLRVLWRRAGRAAGGSLQGKGGSGDEARACVQEVLERTAAATAVCRAAAEGMVRKMRLMMRIVSKQQGVAGVDVGLLQEEVVRAEEGCELKVPGQQPRVWRTGWEMLWIRLEAMDATIKRLHVALGGGGGGRGRSKGGS